jgi:hypothetical protein
MSFVEEGRSVSDDNFYKVDLKDALIRNTHNWFPEKTFSAPVLAANISIAAFEFGATRTLIVGEKEWWGVFADVDWFAASSVSLDELRSRIVPFPGQVNSMRPETWLVAYADQVYSTGDNDELAPGNLRDELRVWARGLVFRVAMPDDATGHGSPTS